MSTTVGKINGLKAVIEVEREREDIIETLTHERDAAKARVQELEVALSKCVKAAEARRGEGNSRLLYIIEHEAKTALASSTPATAAVEENQHD